MVTAVHHLVGSAEIGRMLGGLSRQRVQQLINSKGFPSPEVALEMGKVWSRSDIVAWAKANGRTVTDDAEAKPAADE